MSKSLTLNLGFRNEFAGAPYDTLCHTGNISYRLGKKQLQSATLEAIKANKELTESTQRMFYHLGDNEIHRYKHQSTLGVALSMDPKSERFLGNDAANDLLTRPYRTPYVVPATFTWRVVTPASRYAAIAPSRSPAALRAMPRLL